MAPEERRAAYACDVTYCTNKELAFDYLRDRIVLGRTPRPTAAAARAAARRATRASSSLLLRGLHFAIVDEADSVLIDEARTPLIISGRRRRGRARSELYREALTHRATSSTSGADFADRPRERDVELTERGRARLDELCASRSAACGAGRSAREELVRQALAALHLFHRDQHYLVRDGKVQIVDEYTGR